MTETRQCRECGKDYEPQYLHVLNTKILRGGGLCPKCADKAYDDELAKEKAAQAAMIMGDRRKHRVECGIPFKFMNRDFSNFEKGWQDTAFNKCWKYANDFPTDKRPTGVPSLYLYSVGTKDNTGGNGTGKTHITCAIAHRVFDNWKGEERGCPRIIFVSEPDLFRSIQATYSFDQEERRMRESEDDIIKKLTYCDLLLLDDVGKERRQDPRFIQRTLFAIIDGRYKAELPIILTANLDADGLKAHLEEASFDRFAEMIKGKRINMSGKSYRRK